MMLAQLARYGLFYLAVFAAAFRLGWWACCYISDRMDKFDPRIGEGKYRW